MDPQAKDSCPEHIWIPKAGKIVSQRMLQGKRETDDILDFFFFWNAWTHCPKYPQTNKVFRIKPFTKKPTLYKAVLGSVQLSEQGWSDGLARGTELVLGAGTQGYTGEEVSLPTDVSGEVGG